mgnify:CR=1 FL=1
MTSDKPGKGSPLNKQTRPSHSKLEQEISKLKSDLGMSQAAYAGQERAIEALEKKEAQLEKDLAESRRPQVGFLQTINRLRGQVVQFQKDLAKSKVFEDELRRHNKELTAEKDRQKKLIEDREVEIDEQTDALNESAAVKDELRLKIKRLRNASRKLQETVNILLDD